MRIMLAALAVLPLLGGAVLAQPYGYAPVPERRFEGPPPPPPGPHERFVWVEGHWHWDGARYEWRPGHWAERRVGYHEFVPGHWDRTPHGPVWVPDQWR